MASSHDPSAVTFSAQFSFSHAGSPIPSTLLPISVTSCAHFVVLFLFGLVALSSASRHRRRGKERKRAAFFFAPTTLRASLFPSRATAWRPVTPVALSANPFASFSRAVFPPPPPPRRCSGLKWTETHAALTTGTALFFLARAAFVFAALRAASAWGYGDTLPSLLALVACFSDVKSTTVHFPHHPRAVLPSFLVLLAVAVRGVAATGTSAAAASSSSSAAAVAAAAAQAVVAAAAAAAVGGGGRKKMERSWELVASPALPADRVITQVAVARDGELAAMVSDDATVKNRTPDSVQVHVARAPWNKAFVPVPTKLRSSPVGRTPLKVMFERGPHDPAGKATLAVQGFTERGTPALELWDPSGDEPVLLRSFFAAVPGEREGGDCRAVALSRTFSHVAALCGNDLVVVEANGGSEVARAPLDEDLGDLLGIDVVSKGASESGTPAVVLAASKGLFLWPDLSSTTITRVDDGSWKCPASLGDFLAVSFSPDGKRFGVWEKKRATVLATHGDRSPICFNGSRSITACSPSLHLAASEYGLGIGSGMTNIDICDIFTKDDLSRVEHSESQMRSASTLFSDDSSLFLIAHWGTVSVSDVASGSKVGELDFAWSPQARVATPVAISGTNDVIVAANRGTLAVFDARAAMSRASWVEFHKKEVLPLTDENEFDAAREAVEDRLAVDPLARGCPDALRLGWARSAEEVDRLVNQDGRDPRSKCEIKGKPVGAAFVAVTSGNDDAATRLLERHPIPRDSIYPIACEAMYCTCLKTATHMIENYDGFVNWRILDEDGFRYSLLCHAAFSHTMAPMARLLLDAGADPVPRDGDEASALKYAACFGHEEAVDLLLQYVATEESAPRRTAMLDWTREYRRTTALTDALYEGHVSIARKLIDAGCNVVPHPMAKVSALHAAAAAGMDGIVALILDRIPSDPFQRMLLLEWSDNMGMTALAAAAAKDHDGIVRILVAQGCAVVHKVGICPLFAAAEAGSDNAVVALLSCGRNADEQLGWLKSELEGGALDIAVRMGHEKVVSLLLRAGASPAPRAETKTAYYRLSPLASAVFRGHEGVMTLLLDHLGAPDRAKQLLRACLDWQDEDGDTALHFAYVKEDGSGFVSRLLAAGADPTIKNSAGRTPREHGEYHARRRQRRRLVEAPVIPPTVPNITGDIAAVNDGRVHEPQRAVARSLLRVVAGAYRDDGDGLRALFPDGLSVFALVPPFLSLQRQTAHRLASVLPRDSDRFSSVCVLATSKYREAFQAFKASAVGKPRRLHLLLHDEAHYAATAPRSHAPRGAGSGTPRRVDPESVAAAAAASGEDQDGSNAEDERGDDERGAVPAQCLNDPDMLGLRNVFRVLVTATPYNLITKRSRVADRSVVSWSSVGATGEGNPPRYVGIRDFRLCSDEEAETLAHGKVHADDGLLERAQARGAAAAGGSGGTTSINALLVDELIADYKAALWHVCKRMKGFSPDEVAQEAAQYFRADPTRASVAIAETLLSRHQNGLGAMVVVRVTSIVHGKRLRDRLRDVRHDLGLNEHFEIVADVDVGRANFSLRNSTYQERLDGNVAARQSSASATSSSSASGDTVYTDLHGIPCVLILCEKGRMGDTFPSTFLEYDLRLRYVHAAGTLAALEQDLGRACRYARRGDRLPRVYVPKELCNLVRLNPEASGAERDPLASIPPDGRVQIDDRVGFSAAVGRSGCGSISQAPYRSFTSPKRTSSGDPLHYDAYNRVGHHDPRRALLHGLPQVGKTGAYLHFVQLLFDAVEGRLSLDELLSEDPVSEEEERPKEEEEEEQQPAREVRPAPVESDPPLPEINQGPEPRDPENMGRYPDPAQMMLLGHTDGAHRYDDEAGTPWGAPSGTQEADAAMAALACQSPGTTRDPDSQPPAGRPAAAAVSFAVGLCPVPAFQLARDVAALVVPDPSIAKRFASAPPSTLSADLKKKASSLISQEGDGIATRVCTGLVNASSVSVVFVPSSGRAENAFLDYGNALTRSRVGGGTTRRATHPVLQIVVVLEKEYARYATWWPMHTLLVIPDVPRVGGGAVPFEPGHSIGYARCCVQRVAHGWGVPRVWMVDDNVYAWRYLRPAWDPRERRHVIDGEPFDPQGDHKISSRPHLVPSSDGGALSLGTVLAYVEGDPRWAHHVAVGFARPAPNFFVGKFLTRAYARHGSDGAILLHVALASGHGVWFDPALREGEWRDFFSRCAERDLLVTTFRRLVLYKAPTRGGSEPSRRKEKVRGRDEKDGTVAQAAKKRCVGPDACLPLLERDVISVEDTKRARELAEWLKARGLPLSEKEEGVLAVQGVSLSLLQDAATNGDRAWIWATLALCGLTIGVAEQIQRIFQKEEKDTNN